MQVNRLLMGLAVAVTVLVLWALLTSPGDTPQDSPSPVDRSADLPPGNPTRPGGAPKDHPQMSPPRKNLSQTPEMGGLDPRLRPGQPSVGGPVGGAGSYRDDGGGEDPHRNRNPSDFPPPPIVPPAVADRGEGVPPTPQGAGKFARDIAETGAEPPEVPPDPATVAEAQERLRARAQAIAACFAAGAPALQVQVDLLRPRAGETEGFAAGVRLGDGTELDEDVEDCLIEALDSTALPAPPNSRGMIVPLEPL